MSAFQVSPGVQVREFDLTNIIPAVSTSIGAFAGNFNWGPVSEITTISSEKQLANVFGAPTASTFESFFTAASFLKYGNTLKVVRSDSPLAQNSFAGGTFTKIKNLIDYDTQDNVGFTAGTANYVGRNMGAIGNSLSIEVCPASVGDTIFNGWTSYNNLFDLAPGTSTYAANRSTNTNNIANDEVHIVVIDKLGEFTGIPGKVIEVYKNVSLASDARNEDGTTNFYKDVIRNKSKYIWSALHDILFDGGLAAYFLANPPVIPGSPTGAETAAAILATGASNAGDKMSSSNNYIMSVPAILSYNLSNGFDVLPVGSNTITDTQVSDIVLALDLFSDAETEEINILFSISTPTLANSTIIANKVITIATTRKDCVGVISPYTDASTLTSTTAITSAIIAWGASLVPNSSSYYFADSGAHFVFDKYNNKERLIGSAGQVAGLFANTDSLIGPWASPAGLNRGQLRGIQKLAWNPNKASRDSLYKVNINPLVTFPNIGTVLFGDKTGQKKPSAFDRINVRRLFLTIERAISIASKFQLFENNTDITRATFRNMINPYLRDIQGQGGIVDFFVVADATNNTGEVIDSDRFVGDIYIKPPRSINFISLNFIATRTDVAFSEIIGQF